MKNRVKYVFSEVINSSAISMCSKYTDNFTVFTCAHQVRKYVYRLKQNVFNGFHILIDDCQGYIQWCV